MPQLLVSVPYEFTLLSNHGYDDAESGDVSVPYEFTLLSNHHDAVWPRA